MAIFQSTRSVSSFAIYLFLALHLHHLGAWAHLLPIVDPQGGNGSTIETYIVHVYQPDGDGDGGGLLSSEERENWYRSFLPNTTLDSGEPRLVNSYHHVISGFAARLTRHELQAMEAMDGFVMAQPVGSYRLLTTYTPQFLGLPRGWDGLWDKSSYGNGVIIGMLDSGITPDHPSFKDDGMPAAPKKWRGCCQVKTPSCSRWVPSICNNKLLGAVSTATPRYPSAIDKRGHGTHVAGTAAGNFVDDAEVLGLARGKAAGMAPRAHLASYKVCSDAAGAGCDYNYILAGIEHAMEDGVDVLSMSIGDEPTPFFLDNIIKGTFAAMERGIFSSCCAGNEGRFETVIANDAPWILTVGASAIDRVMRATVRLGNGMELDGESAYQPKDHVPVTVPILYPGSVEDTDARLSCLKGSLDDLDAKGKIVLCGTMNSENIDKGEVVKAAGGAGLIVLNQGWNGFTTWANTHVLPAVHLTHVDSLKIVSYAKTDPNPTATIIFKGTWFGTRPAPAVADFSSRGPSSINGGIIKPDIIGPGVNILAAWSTDVGPDATGTSTSSFNFGSGCSMATPHLAGIAALIKNVHPDWSPAAIKSAIMTTADTVDRSGQPISDEKSNTRSPASYFAMGAGHVNPAKASDPGLVYDNQPDDYIPYLCGLYRSSRLVFSITKRQVDCYSIKGISAAELNYPSILVSMGSAPTTTIERTVTNVGEANSVYTVQVTEPQGAGVVVSPEKLEFSDVGEKKTYTVTFSKKGSSPGKDKYSEGQLEWVSDKHSVRSPIVVKF